MIDIGFSLTVLSVLAVISICIGVVIFKQKQSNSSQGRNPNRFKGRFLKGLKEL